MSRANESLITDIEEMIKPQTPMDHFIRQYLITALWSSVDEDGVSLDEAHTIFDIHPDCVKMLIRAATDFYWEFESLILSEDAPLGEFWTGSTVHQRKAAMAGHDFWLTQHGHGAGFGDGDWNEIAVAELTTACQARDAIDLYIDDHGLINC